MRLLLLITILILNFHSPTGQGAEIDGGPNIYMVNKQESLDSLAAKLLPKFKKKYNQNIDDIKKDLKQWNPHIHNWDNIPIDSNLYVESPYPVYISYHYAPPLEFGKNYNSTNTDSETPIGKNRYTVFATYTASTGSFSEQLSSQSSEIKSTQNSPYTLGLGSSIFLNKSSQILATSLYWSNLRPSITTGAGASTTKFASMSEFGGNLYYQQLITSIDLNLYTGIDYEQFPTYNTIDYINGASLGINKNNLLYGSLGVAHTFFWGDRKIILKGTVSQSLTSSTSSVNSSDRFKGNRILLFTSLKGESRFTYHFIFKRHMLEGPSKLTINRIGLGVGFVLF